MAQNSSYPTFAVRTTLEQNVLQLAQMSGFNEEHIKLANSSSSKRLRICE